MLNRRESVQTDGNTIECNDVSREAIIGQRVGKMALQNPKAVYLICSDELLSQAP